MKISVIMVDGGFRENIYSAEYFARQEFPDDQYEIIWVEYFNNPHPKLKEVNKVKVINLNKTDEYHSSYCFNKGIEEANGEVIVIPDADQIVAPNFLSSVWEKHQKYHKLVLYIYRYDEIEKNSLHSFNFEELEKKCILKNPLNYGGCLTVRKKWLIEINGYEMHPIFRSGFHANGLDIYTRFKNLGLAIQWDTELKLYHPWHPTTLSSAPQYEPQKKMINWRYSTLNYLAVYGIEKNKNLKNINVIDMLNKFDKDTSLTTTGNNSVSSNKLKSLIRRVFS